MGLVSTSMRLLERRAALFSAVLLGAAQPPLPSRAALSGVPDTATADELAAAYAAGARADGGRGANTMIRKRAESGVQRVGSDSPVFKPGAILDGVRSADGSTVDVSFAYPKEWTVAGGPNLDVRDVRTSDSAYLLAAPLPSGQALDTLPRSFFAELLFRSDGKYGAYGGVDDFAIAESGVALLSSPSGGEQPYRRLSLRFDVLTYNQNTVRRRALVSATAAGGSVYVLVASCLGSRFKEAQPALASIQDSFRALAAPRRLRPGPEDKPA